MAWQKIGRYEIERKLGEGGMASVHLARDPSMKRQVAIKVLPREFTDDSQFRARFRREAEIVARLEHPHIVPVYDLGEHKGQPFIVMRYMTGGSLSERVKRGRLPLAETARIVSALASALDYAHGKGIIHRDLKPANIMFDGEGQPFISDFGIAKLTEATTHLTGTGLIGTPMYMSPEQWRGDQSLDARSDVYALGVMTFEMLSGRAPFEASTPAQIMYRHLMDAPPRLADVIPDLPVECNAIIERAMAKEPGARYSSAGEMARALTALVPPPPKPAPPPVVEMPPTIPPRLVEKKPAEPKPVIAEAARPAQAKPPTPKPIAAKAAQPAVAKPAKLSEGDLRPTGVIVEKPKRAWTPFVIGAALLAVVGLIAGGGAMIAAARNGATPTQIALATDTLQPAVTRAPTLGAIAQPTQELPSTTPAPNTAAPVSPTPAPALGIGSSKVSEKDGMVQMYVPEGEFLMGSADTDPDAQANEKPQHTVYLDAFWIDKTEVTNEMYKKCVASDVCAPPGSGGAYSRPDYYENAAYANYPVVQVTWNDASMYCKWAGRKLPTEAEWEKAARGTNGETYPWGESEPSPSLLNFNWKVGNTSEVGIYPSGASPYGALDMAGNVWEWIADWYDEQYYGVSPVENPQGPSSGLLRASRGASWIEGVPRVASRYSNTPDDATYQKGFRCAQSASGTEAATAAITPTPSASQSFSVITLDNAAELVEVAQASVPDCCRGFAFSPDGKMLAVGITNGVELRDGFTLALIEQLDMGTGVFVGGFSPDGELLAVALGNNVELWNIKTKTVVYALSGHVGGIQSIDFSSDGKLLASGAGYPDRTAKIWDVTSGKEIHSLSHPVGVTSVVFSPDGSILATGAQTAAVRIWDAGTGKLVRQFDFSGGSFYIAYHLSGNIAIGVVDQNVGIAIATFDLDTGLKLQTTKVFFVPIIFSPDASVAISGDRLWDVTDGLYKILPQGIYQGVNSGIMGFSPDGAQLLTFSDGALRLWAVRP